MVAGYAALTRPDRSASSSVSPSLVGPAPSAEPTAVSSPTPESAASSSPSASAPGTPPQSLALSMYGAPRSGLPWHSGFWTGGTGGTGRINAAGTWRGTPMDFVTVYPAYETWSEIRDSGWTVSAYAGFKGRLAYGLALLPKNRKGQWQDVISGRRDDVFRRVAQDLVEYGHGDAAIRMGVEANGYWFPWAVTQDTVDEFKAAYVRIHTVMSSVSPDFTYWLDLNCGTVLTGNGDRLAPLVQMYPGDDVVDGISMDHYNRFKLLATDEASWQRAIAPSWAVGLRDGVDFARLHGKGFAVPEWGLDGVQGPGDSPFFMRRMFEFFTESQDVLVFENYFSEPDPYIAGGLFDSSENPKSAAVYRQLWGRRG